MKPFYYEFVNRRDFNLRHEPEGDIQPKYWFSSYDNSKKFNRPMLVKRTMIHKGSNKRPKSVVHNPIGEYFGYLLGKKMGLDICPVHLLSFYDKEKKYSKSERLYPACASVSQLTYGQSLEHGESVVSSFEYENPSKVNNILEKSPSYSTIFPRKGAFGTASTDEHIEIILAAIDYRVRNFESAIGKRTPEQIEQDVKDARRKMIEMVVYDCAFGNNDRHSRNWGLMLDRNEGRATVYSAYDNERVLGLCSSEYEMNKLVEAGPKMMSLFQLKAHYSRIGFGSQKGGVYYEDMLEYLVEKHPEYAIPAIEKVVRNVKPRFVEELYDSLEDIDLRSSKVDELPPEQRAKFVVSGAFKEFGMRMYNERYNFMQRLLNKQIKKIDTLEQKSDPHYSIIKDTKTNQFIVVNNNPKQKQAYREDRE